jgi:hypothetical protein
MPVKYQIHGISSNVSDFLFCLSFGEIIDLPCQVNKIAGVIPYSVFAIKALS